MEEVFIKTKEAAKFLCVSMSKMTKMCHKKEVPYYKAGDGRLNLFIREELVEFIEKHKVLTIKELQNLAESKLLDVANEKTKNLNN